MLAKLRLKKGDAANALNDFRNALTYLEPEPARSEVSDKLAKIYEGIGDILISMNGKLAEAREMYQKSLEFWQKLKETNKLDGGNVNKPDEVSQKIAKLNS